MAPSDSAAEQFQIEDLLALNERVGPAGVCLCGIRIVQLGTGVWRSDTHPLGRDRIACGVSDDRRHHPREISDIAPLCLTCGDELEPSADGWAGPDGSTTCPRTGRPHSVRQIVPDPEERS